MPLYCLNQVGVPKRPEITPADFAKALEDQPLVVIRLLASADDRIPLPDRRPAGPIVIERQ